ncbi:MAG TPA: GNAT family N-acetyltransferase [Cellulomonas sp.]
MTAVLRVGWDDPDVAVLRTVQQAELRELYGDDDIGHTMTGDGVLAAVLVRGDDGTALACGALRDAPELGAGTGELKRMYVAPGRRGAGLSRQVVEELEAIAAEAGLTRLVLETGALQASAIGLYLSAGYVPIDRFAPYEDETTSRCFAKELGAPAPARVAGVVDTEGIVVERTGWTDPTAVALRAEMGAFLRSLYGRSGWFADAETVAAADRAEAARALVVLVARDEAGPLGTLTLSADPDGRPAGWGELERLLVLPRSRRRGVARMLLREAEREARARGMSAVTLSTGYLQLPAMRLYLAAGYRIVEAAGARWRDQGRLFWFAKAL